MRTLPLVFLIASCGSIDHPSGDAASPPDDASGEPDAAAVPDAAVDADVPAHALAVTIIGDGTGRVTGAGIDCGADCNESYAEGTMVTLTAQPATGSSFDGWASGCTGSAPTCVVTIGADVTVRARFTTIPPNYVFVTSTQTTGNMGGLTGADHICQTRASAAGLPGTYRAWLSTPSVNAIARLGSARGWVRPDGKPFADTTADIAAGKIFYPPRLDELGADIGLDDVFTATTANGTLYPGFTTCGDYTSTSGSIEIGFSTGSSSMFTVMGSASCSSMSPIYCFGIDNQAVVAPPVATGRRAFTSNAPWTPGGGLASADARCQSEASAAGLPGTFRALLATTSGSAISRFSTAGAVWRRPDHTLVGGANLSTPGLQYIEASPASNAAGTTYFDNYGVWTGAGDLTTAGSTASTCNNWTSTSGSGRGGRAGDTFVFNWIGLDSGDPCNANYIHLVCLQL